MSIKTLWTAAELVKFAKLHNLFSDIHGRRVSARTPQGGLRRCCGPTAATPICFTTILILMRCSSRRPRPSRKRIGTICAQCDAATNATSYPAAAATRRAIQCEQLDREAEARKAIVQGC